MSTGDDLAQARSIPLKHERDDARFIGVVGLSAPSLSRQS
jgi:hypothetical protein